MAHSFRQNGVIWNFDGQMAPSKMIPDVHYCMYHHHNFILDGILYKYIYIYCIVVGNLWGMFNGFTNINYL